MFPKYTQHLIISFCCYVLTCVCCIIRADAQIASGPQQILLTEYYAYGGVFPAGDINLDGYDDIFISDIYYDPGLTNRGIVDLYYGSPTGVTLISAWQIKGDSANTYLGQELTVNDFNGDGLNDIAVSAAFLNKGKVWIFYNTGAGFSTTPNQIIYGLQMDSDFGIGIKSADFNNDGYCDLAIGADSYVGDQNDEGRIYLYLGSITGLHAVPDMIYESNVELGRIGQYFAFGDFNSDGFADLALPEYTGLVGRKLKVFNGSAIPDLVADQTCTYSSGVGPTYIFNAGDINNDGYDDIVFSSQVGSFDKACVVQYGSISGLNNYEIRVSLFKELATDYGDYVAGLGDVNDDGYADIMVGEPLENTPNLDAGRAHVFYGHEDQLSFAPDWSYRNITASEKLGFSVYGIGDVNGDGFNDAAVGFSTKNEIYLFFGSENGLKTLSDFSMSGNNLNQRYGYSVDRLGDYNEDGFDDFVVGSPGTTSSYPGKGVDIWNGDSNLPILSQTLFNEDNYSNGWQVAFGGDINNDAKTDLLVSGYGWSDYNGFLFYNVDGNFSFDSSWATIPYNYNDQPYRISINYAGDVNNDGYDDILIGGLGKSSSENFATGSAVRLFYGDENMSDYDPNFATYSDTALWLNIFSQDSADFGRALGSVGDINGDGYDDFFASAPRFDNGSLNEGIFHIYLGSPGYPSTIPYWSFESNQAGAQAGYSADFAGDLNGDGYGDLIIGAPYYDNGQTDEGAVFIFYGIAGGFPVTPSLVIEGNQTGSNFGISCKGINDFNGDGFKDIIVGAYKYDNGQIDEGRAFIYAGSASGLITTPILNPESDLASSAFGFSVAGTGDINSDGYDDVVVGAYAYAFDHTQEGAAFVYFGEPSCSSITDITLMDVNEYDVTFSWTTDGEPDSYLLYYKKTTDPAWTIIPTDLTELLITGLLPCVNYELKVQSVCGVFSGTFSDIITFTTDCPCAAAPVGLYTDAITTTSAMLHWDTYAYATSYKIYYKPIGAASWTTVNSITNSKLISGLVPGTIYNWKIKSVCDMIQSPFSSLEAFTTPLKSLNDQNDQSFTIYPNPNNGEFSIYMHGFETGQYNLEIRDITGRQLYSQTLNLTQTEYEIQPTISGITKGVLTIILTSNTSVNTRIVIIN